MITRDKMIKQIIDYKGKKVELLWHDDTNFETLTNVTQAYGFCFNNKGEILLISLNGKNWSLPGGNPEKEDISYEQTLIREVLEEGDCEIDKIIRLGYQNSVFVGDPKSTHQQLRYVARIKKIRKQSIDPAYDKVLKRKFIKPGEFLDYCPWGKIGEYMTKKAVKIWKENLK